MIEQHTKMSEPRIFAGATEKLPGWEKPHAKTVAWSYDMEGHARQCVERYCELAHKKMEQLDIVSSPCLDDHQFKQQELEQTFYGLTTNLQEQWQNGRRLATDDWQD